MIVLTLMSQTREGVSKVGEPSSLRSIAVVLVTEFEGRVVVAFPQKAWDRKVVAQRILPAGPFTKPLCRSR